MLLNWLVLVKAVTLAGLNAAVLLGFWCVVVLGFFFKCVT